MYVLGTPLVISNRSSIHSPDQVANQADFVLALFILVLIGLKFAGFLCNRVTDSAGIPAAGRVVSARRLVSRYSRGVAQSINHNHRR